jgi:hypothetical protein
MITGKRTMEFFKSFDSQKRNLSQNQIVPMGETFHKTEPSQLITCSSCQLKPESGTHLCRCPTRRAAMEDVFLQDPFQTFLQDNHMCPKLAHALLKALCCDCHEARHPGFTSRHGATDLKHRQPHHHQALVGWSQLFQGRPVTNWSQLQEEFLEQGNDQLKLDRRCHAGDAWARKLVSLLWSTTRPQWDHRNAD